MREEDLQITTYRYGIENRISYMRILHKPTGIIIEESSFPEDPMPVINQLKEKLSQRVKDYNKIFGRN